MLGARVRRKALRAFVPAAGSVSCCAAAKCHQLGPARRARRRPTPGPAVRAAWNAESAACNALGQRRRIPIPSRAAQPTRCSSAAACRAAASSACSDSACSRADSSTSRAGELTQLFHARFELLLLGHAPRGAFGRLRASRFERSRLLAQRLRPTPAASHSRRSDRSPTARPARFPRPSRAARDSSCATCSRLNVMRFSERSRSSAVCPSRFCVCRSSASSS